MTDEQTKKNITVGDLPTEVHRFEDDVEKARKAGDKAAEAEALEWLAGSKYGMGQVEDGLTHMKDAVSLRRAIGDVTALGKALMWYARMRRGTGEISSAYHPAEEAFKLLSVLDDVALAMESSIELASVMTARAELPGALRTLRAVEKKIPDTAVVLDLSEGEYVRRHFPIFYRDLAIAAQACGDWEGAANAWKVCRAWFDGIGEAGEAMMARFAQAPLYDQAGQHKKALEAWFEVISLAREAGDKQTEAQCYAALATVALREQMRDKALEWATYARSLALQHVDPLTYVNSTAVLAECYDHQGLRTRAFELMANARSLLEDSMGLEAADGFLSLLEGSFKKRWGQDTWDKIAASRGPKKNDVQ